MNGSRGAVIRSLHPQQLSKYVVIPPARRYKCHAVSRFLLRFGIFDNPTSHLSLCLSIESQHFLSDALLPASAPPARPRRLACQVGAGHLRVARPSNAACRQLDCCRCLRSQQVTALPKLQARERTSLFHPDYQRRVLRYGTGVTHCWRQTRAAFLEKLEQTPQSSLGFAVRRTLLVCQSVCALQVSGSYLAACRPFPSRTHLAIAHGDRAFPQGLGLVINCSVNKIWQA